MAKQSINVGTTPNDGTGDALRDGFIKTNDNFTELYNKDQDLDANKVDKEAGKGLSENDYTNADKSKVDNLPSDTLSILSNKADLVGGTVPMSQLPSGVKNVEEYDDLASFPATGEPNKIYIAKDTNILYRWETSAYEIVSEGSVQLVTSVNAQTGDVVLDADDINDSSTTNKFVTSSDLTKLGNLSGVNSGDQTITLTGDVTGSGTSSFSTSISSDSVTLGKIQNAVSNDKILGSGNTGSGNNYEELTLGTGISITGSTINVTATGSGESNTASNIGTGTADIFKQKTGLDLEFRTINSASATLDITSSSDEVEINIANNAVGNSELKDMPANSIKGNNTASFGDPTDIVISETSVVGRLPGGNIAALSPAQFWQYLSYGYVENTTLVTTTGVAVIYTTLTTSNLDAGNYTIESSWICRNSATNGDWQVKITEGTGAAGTNTDLISDDMIEEGIDAGTNQRYPRHISRDVALTSGVKNINIEIYQVGAGTMSMHYGCIRLTRKS